MDKPLIINVADAPAFSHSRRSMLIDFEPDEAPWPDTGVNIQILQPGQPNCRYHSEPVQEDFLVLHGECIAILDGEERVLRQWDFLHCPAGTEHVFVGAGDGPCAVLMIGSQARGRRPLPRQRRGRAVRRLRHEDDRRPGRGLRRLAPGVPAPGTQPVAAAVTAVFDARAHEPLLDVAWSPAEVQAEIRAIARDAEDALRDAEWWAIHPLDAEDDDPDVFHGIYLGAAGVLWALHRLAQAGLHEPRHDYARLAEDVLDSYLRRPELDGPLPSLWLGEGGIALVAWLLSARPALADRLAELVVVEPDSDSLELTWGSPGLLLIADAMLGRTGEPRWTSAWSAIADRLMRQRGADVPDFWTQRLDSSTEALLGAAHGLAGVGAALARRPELLPPGELVPRITAALSATAIRDGERANWPPGLGQPLENPGGFIRTQWCHGAPGIVACIAALPREDELDALLLAGGELTWAAGPLRKGANLCHGTAGNGFALLKLFTRTADESWLVRARGFAMHSAGQVAAARRQYGHGRHSLWTGDLGTAMYLQQCLAATSEMPTIDLW